MPDQFPKPPWHAAISRRLARIHAGLPTLALCFAACAAALAQHTVPFGNARSQTQQTVVANTPAGQNEVSFTRADDAARGHTRNDNADGSGPGVRH
jgi:hypothetical protein